MSGANRSSGAVAWPVALDLTLIILFALIGRRTHDEGSALGGVLTIAAPFLIGYAVAAAIGRIDRAPRDPKRAGAVAILAVALGMALRGTVFDRGLAPAFVIVAFVTVTAFLVAWRLVAITVGRSRRRAAG